MLRRATLAGIIAIFVIDNACGESKRHPSHRKPPIQEIRDEPAQPSAPNQRGTDQIPCTVKVLPGEDAKEKAEREERERREKDEKAATDKRLTDQTQRLADETERLARYTGWLSWFTMLLFCTAVAQVALFVWQLQLIRETAEAARVGAKAAKDQAKISRKAYVADQRPWVYAINVIVSKPTFYENGKLFIPLTFTLKNTGRSPAVLVIPVARAFESVM